MLAYAALITGVGLGSMYGLLALGFHVTYAVSNTVNFAQGSTMMLGAVLCFTFWVTFGWPLALAIPASLLLCAVWSVVVERIAVRPFVRSGSNSWLMATVALGIVIENVVLFTFGKDPRGMPAGFLTTTYVPVGGIKVQALQLHHSGDRAAAGGRHPSSSQRTRYGKALLAVVQNRDAARLMGIDIERVVMASFALSGFLAGVAGILVAPLFTISSTMGTLFGIKAFAVAILGGIGSAWGVVLAGLIYGIVEALITRNARLDLHPDRHLRARDRRAGRAAERTVRPRRGEEGMTARTIIAAVLALAALGFAIAKADGYQIFIIALVGLTAIVGIGLNVLLGLTGQISFGHVAFYAIGAYTVGILTTKAGLSFWLALPAAMVISGVAGLALAVPALAHPRAVSGDGHDRVRIRRRAGRGRVERPDRRLERTAGNSAAERVRIRIQRARHDTAHRRRSRSFRSGSMHGSPRAPGASACARCAIPRSRASRSASIRC